MILLGSTHLHGQDKGLGNGSRQNLTGSPRVYNLLREKTVQVLSIVHKSKSGSFQSTEYRADILHCALVAMVSYYNEHPIHSPCRCHVNFDGIPLPKPVGWLPRETPFP